MQMEAMQVGSSSRNIDIACLEKVFQLDVPVVANLVFFF